MLASGTAALHSPAHELVHHDLPVLLLPTPTRPKVRKMGVTNSDGKLCLNMLQLVDPVFAAYLKGGWIMIKLGGDVVERPAVLDTIQARWNLHLTMGETAAQLMRAACSAVFPTGETHAISGRQVADPRQAPSALLRMPSKKAPCMPSGEGQAQPGGGAPAKPSGPATLGGSACRSQGQVCMGLRARFTSLAQHIERVVQFVSKIGHPGTPFLGGLLLFHREHVDATQQRSDPEFWGALAKLPDGGGGCGVRRRQQVTRQGPRRHLQRHAGDQPGPFRAVARTMPDMDQHFRKWHSEIADELDALMETARPCILGRLDALTSRVLLKGRTECSHPLKAMAPLELASYVDCATVADHDLATACRKPTGAQVPSPRRAPGGAGRQLNGLVSHRRSTQRGARSSAERPWLREAALRAQGSVPQGRRWRERWWAWEDRRGDGGPDHCALRKVRCGILWSSY